MASKELVKLVKEIESIAGSVPHYLYGSILSNFVEYVQKKMMARLKIMAAHCPSHLQVSDPKNLPRRGANLF